MKKNKKFRIVLPALLAVVVLAVCYSCEKTRYCYCTTQETELPDTVIWNVERGLKCDRLMKLGMEETVTVEGENNQDYTEQVPVIYNYTCVELDRDTLSVFDSLHVD